MYNKKEKKLFFLTKEKGPKEAETTPPPFGLIMEHCDVCAGVVTSPLPL